MWARGPDDVLAVGDNGATLHLGGGGAHRPSRSLMSATLHAVGGFDDVVIAVGGELANATASQRAVILVQGDDAPDVTLDGRTYVAGAVQGSRPGGGQYARLRGDAPRPNCAFTTAMSASDVDAVEERREGAPQGRSRVLARTPRPRRPPAPDSWGASAPPSVGRWASIPTKPAKARQTPRRVIRRSNGLRRTLVTVGFADGSAV